MCNLGLVSQRVKLLSDRPTGRIIQSLDIDNIRKPERQIAVGPSAATNWPQSRTIAASLKWTTTATATTTIAPTDPPESLELASNGSLLRACPATGPPAGPTQEPTDPSSLYLAHNRRRRRRRRRRRLAR